MAMNVRRKLICGIAIAFVVCALALVLMGKRINVIAMGPVNLYDKPMDGQIIKVLKPGEVMAVVVCEDVKHYIIPVVLVDGRRAYVQEGDYRLDRKAAWEFSAGPISLSCP